MKVFVHYCPHGFSNCYIMGTDIIDDTSPRDAVLVDPGSMETPMLDFIENNDYKLRGILITHDHVSHVQGLRTLKRIFDVDIYAVNPMVQKHKAKVVRDGDILELGAITITVITLPGHSPDSVIYRINQTLLTGDTITSGLLGATISSYGKTKQMDGLRSKVLSQPGNFVILPGHGPPSTLDAERRYNAGIQDYELSKNRRIPFRVDID